ncbi:hypothetical protein Nmel_017461 [Mimus melanotis]
MLWNTGIAFPSTLKKKVMSILLLIEYSLEVANGKGFCKDLDKDYFRIGGSGNTGKQLWAGRDSSVLHCSLCLFQNLGF